jgi:hypothetical protein
MKLPREPQECLECGTEFTPSRSDALTCSSRCRSARWRRMQWREPRPGFRTRMVEAQPDDPMFGRMHVAFFTDPEPTPEANGRPEQPVDEDEVWEIDIPIGPKQPRARFRGLRPVDPNAPWTIHLRPKPGSGEQD